MISLMAAKQTMKVYLTWSTIVVKYVGTHIKTRLGEQNITLFCNFVAGIQVIRLI